MNTARRRICAVSGSRADYGLLLPVLSAIRSHPGLRLQLAVTGSHLEQRHGHTLDAILADGFAVDAQVPMHLKGDDAASVAAGLATAVRGFATELDRLHPDLLLVLGDRYEILGAVETALLMKIPVAHIAGGDVTEGAFDDAIRHAITKMAHLHFVTHETAARRVRQLGEADERVFVTGSPGIDQILRTPLLGRDQLALRFGMPLQARNLAITFHPATLDQDDALCQLEELLSALARLDDSFGLIFTGANADPRGQAINARLREFVGQHRTAEHYASLGQQAYYSLLAIADAVVGNSSSGLYEAPSLATPTVNIGNRQAGRLKADSVIDCSAEGPAIARAIARAIAMDCGGVVNPYGDGQATTRIMRVLGGPWDRQDLLHKGFADRDCDR